MLSRNSCIDALRESTSWGVYCEIALILFEQFDIRFCTGWYQLSVDGGSEMKKNDELVKKMENYTSQQTSYASKVL